MTAQELRKPHLYGNFRQRGIKPKKKRQTRPGMSKKHLALIRQLPCCVTGWEPCGEAHHLKGTGERGMGMRSTDRWAVPLSHEPHMQLEGYGSLNERAWFRYHGISDPHALADALWHSSGDLERMKEIVRAHRGGS